MKCKETVVAVSRKAESVVTSKGQLTVPAIIRRSLGIQSGDRIRFEVTGPDRMTVTIRKRQDVFEMIRALPPLSEPEPLDRAAINRAADEALGEKFSHPANGRKGGDA
jgi:AbrB family looped-hinge helix DNA binding protein